MTEKTSTFFAAVSRMKYIERWSLMRSSRPESLSEHSLEVAMIAHALCTIANIRFGRTLNAEKAALVGLYHDASEIITGDLPTPIKYYNPDIRDAFKGVEAKADERLISKLPKDLQRVYTEIFLPQDADDDEAYMRGLVKAADKLSALIKCIEERKSGNSEFRMAEKSIQESLDRMCESFPEVQMFLDEFLPPYGGTLDELK